MDPLTHGLLGATVAGFAAPRFLTRKQSALIGVLAGMAPDLDIFIRSSQDPLLALEYHRQFTHSLAFAPLGAGVVTLLLFLLWRGRVSPLPIYVSALLAWLSHEFLDTCTSYGTQLLWPFADTRVAWNVIGIIDLFFTGALIAGLAMFWRGRSLRVLAASLGFAALYLAVGLWQRERVKGLLGELARSRGLEPVRIEAKPTIGNLWLWRGITEASGKFYVDAYHTWPGSRPVLYVGGSVDKIEGTPSGVEPESVQARDIERFRWFSDDFLAKHPSHDNVIGDVRYAVLPDDIHPLWGIVVDPSRRNEYVPFENFREMREGTGRRILQRMLGKDLEK